LKLLNVASVVLVAASVLAGCNEDGSGMEGSASSSKSSSASTTSQTTTHSSTGSSPTTSAAVNHSATLTWRAPTTYTDGAALTNLAGYRIYYGSNASKLVQNVQLDVVGLQSYVFNNLGSGTWYFAIRAVTNTGAESALSDVVSLTIH
jgi:hypothetical protein